MLTVRRCFCSIFLVPLAYAGSESDAVNERISVSRAELESHWQVDCGAGWARLVNAVIQSRAGGGCEIAVGLRGELELCAFIYQPPGGGVNSACPDYRGAVGLLDSAGASGEGEICVALAHFLERKAVCRQPPPAQ